MLTFYHWLAQHRIWNAIILVAYYLLVVLPHEFIGISIANLFVNKSRLFYNNVILVFASTLAIVVLVPFLIRLLRHPRRQIGWGYLLSLVGLITLAFNTIIIVNIELIHIIQYAVFAIIAFPLMKGYTMTLMFTTLLGAVDEAYQYFYLSPQRTDYYDLNDIVLNTLGGAVGLLWLWCYEVETRYRRIQEIISSWQSVTVVAVIVGIISSIRLGYLAYFPTEGIKPLWTLVRKSPEGFWKTIDAGTITFHITLPLEGLFYCILLWLLYGSMDLTVKVEK